MNKWGAPMHYIFAKFRLTIQKLERSRMDSYNNWKGAAWIKRSALQDGLPPVKDRFARAPFKT